MAKEFIKNLTQKGSAIKHQMERGLTNAQISKSLGIPESTVRYYRKRPELKKLKELLNCLKNILRKFTDWLQTRQREKCQED